MTILNAEPTRVSVGKVRAGEPHSNVRLCKARAFFSAVQHRPEAVHTPFAKTASVARIFSALVALVALSVGRVNAQNSATLAWDPVQNANVSGYKVYEGTKSGTYSFSTNVGTATQVTLGGLLTGTQYFFSVTALNSAGESPYATEVSYTVPSTTNS